MSNDIMSTGSKQTRGNALESYPEGGSLRVTLAEVPAYLQKGELFRNLKQNEDTGINGFERISVPKNCLKQMDSVRDDCELSFLLNSFRYWAVEELSESVYAYLSTQRHAPSEHLRDIAKSFPAINQSFVVTLPPQSTKAPGYSGAPRRPATIEISPQAGPCLARHGMLCSSRNRTADLLAVRT
jgi:hypothetical protein